MNIISHISSWWSDRHRRRLISSAQSLVDCLNTVESLVTEGKVSRDEADQIHGAVMLAFDEDILPRAVEQGFVREVIQVISGIQP